MPQAGRRANPFAGLLNMFGTQARVARETQADLALYDAKRGIDHDYQTKYYTHKVNEDTRGMGERDAGAIGAWDKALEMGKKHNYTPQDFAGMRLPSGFAVDLQRRGNIDVHRPPADDADAERAAKGPAGDGKSPTGKPPAVDPIKKPTVKKTAKPKVYKRASSVKKLINDMTPMDQKAVDKALGRKKKTTKPTKPPTA